MTKQKIKTIVLIADKKNQKIAKKIAIFIEKKFQYNLINCFSEKNFIQDMIDSLQLYLNDNTQIIILDDYGILPFLVASKLKKTIVAQLEDEHSAKMTRMHNNANVITLGTQVLGYELLLNILVEYLKNDYEGGRHKVRLDMLDELLKKEGK